MSGQNDSGKGIGKTTTEMKTNSTLQIGIKYLEYKKWKLSFINMAKGR